MGRFCVSVVSRNRAPRGGSRGDGPRRPSRSGPHPQIHRDDRPPAWSSRNRSATEHSLPRTSHNFAALVSKWAAAWRVPALPEMVSVTFSNRLRRSLGRVRPRTGAITLNAKLATAPRKVVREVLCHEAAHVANFMLHGIRAKPHGPEWCALVRAAGYNPTTALGCRWVPPPAPAQRMTSRIKYRCPVCHAVCLGSKHASLLHCGECLRSGVLVRLCRV
jgi:predicted SprT family Zn-dependent metalloprotease